MPLAEGAAPAVLTAQPDRGPFVEKGCKSQGLRVCPIDPFAFFHGSLPPCIEGGDFGVRSEARGECRHCFRKRKEPGTLHAGFNLCG